MFDPEFILSINYLVVFIAEDIVSLLKNFLQFISHSQYEILDQGVIPILL